MAGGVGSRFWPLSRKTYPKQFIDILGTGKTFLQHTFERFAKICEAENIFIVTNEIYKSKVLEQLPQIKANQVLGEPLMRNTAPCIAYANYKIQKLNPNANIIVAPSDHLILDENEFIDVINNGLEFTKNSDTLLTLGMKPSRPETGYGYIQINKEEKIGTSINKVKTFTEKPDIETAKMFQESGEFFWNSGIFIWSLKSIMKSFEINLNEVNSLFSEGIQNLNTEKEVEFINKIYPKCKNISIDYGIMEKAENVYVYLADFGWSDLGTWGSLYEHSRLDDNNNAVFGDNVFLYDSKNCIVNIPKNKLIVLQGLDDYIVVDSNDALLVCKKKDEQQIKKFVHDISKVDDEKYI